MHVKSTDDSYSYYDNQSQGCLKLKRASYNTCVPGHYVFLGKSQSTTLSLDYIIRFVHAVMSANSTTSTVYSSRP